MSRQITADVLQFWGWCGGGDFITNDILKFRCWFWKFIYCNLLLPYFIYLIIDGKKYLSIKKVVKDLRNLLMIKLWAYIPITVSLWPAESHMYKWTLWTIHPSLVSCSWKNTRVKARKIRNILHFIFYCLFECNFYW